MRIRPSLLKDFNFIKFKPYPFQYQAFEFGICRDHSALLLGTGMGKTFVAINIARFRMMRKQVKKTLVVCPTSVILNWEDSIHEFSEHKATPIMGVRDKRISLLQEKSDFCIINYEALAPKRTKKGVNQELFKTIRDKKFDMMIFDESSRYIRNPDAKRTQASILLSDPVKHKLILTATPIANRPLDLWAQYRVLDNGKTLTDNYYRFRNKYFERDSDHPFAKWILKSGAANSLGNVLYRSSIRFLKEECLELPQKIESTIRLKFDNSSQNIYNEVRDQVIAEVETQSGIAQLKVKGIFAKLVRLQQITSGFTVKEGKPVRLKDQPKLNAIVDDIDSVVDAGESIIVWCRYKPSIRMIEEELDKLKIRYLTMTGDTKDKYATWRTFQTRSTFPVFIGQIESGGIGIELFKEPDLATKAQHMRFYENVWTPDVRIQAYDRINRIGQTSETLVYKDYLVQGTIDERIMQSIHEKIDIADTILSQGIRRFLGG